MGKGTYLSCVLEDIDKSDTLILGDSEYEHARKVLGLADA